MNRATLIRYTPLYVSLTITAIVLTVLFLLPGAALGLVVEVDTPENDRNSLSGFALGEAIPINARVNLEGEFETLISELEIEQISGGPGFINVTGTGAVTSSLATGAGNRGRPFRSTVSGYPFRRCSVHPGYYQSHWVSSGRFWIWLWLFPRRRRRWADILFLDLYPTSYNWRLCCDDYSGA